MSKCGTLSPSWCVQDFSACRPCWQKWRLNSVIYSVLILPSTTLLLPYDCCQCRTQMFTHRVGFGLGKSTGRKLYLLHLSFSLSPRDNSRFQKLFLPSTSLKKNISFNNSVYSNEKLIAPKHFQTSCIEDEVINICLLACFVSGVIGR